MGSSSPLTATEQVISALHLHQADHERMSRQQRVTCDATDAFERTRTVSPPAMQGSSLLSTHEGCGSDGGFIMSIEPLCLIPVVRCPIKEEHLGGWG